MDFDGPAFKLAFDKPDPLRPSLSEPLFERVLVQQQARQYSQHTAKRRSCLKSFPWAVGYQSLALASCKKHWHHSRGEFADKTSQVKSHSHVQKHLLTRASVTFGHRCKSCVV